MRDLVNRVDRAALLRMLVFRAKVCDLFNEYDDLPPAALFHTCVQTSEEFMAIAALVSVPASTSQERTDAENERASR